MTTLLFFCGPRAPAFSSSRKGRPMSCVGLNEGALRSNVCARGDCSETRLSSNPLDNSIDVFGFVIFNHQ